MGEPPHNSKLPYQTLTIFTIFFIQALLAKPHLTKRDQNMVTFACNHTLYQDLCISSLTSDPRSKTADLKTLATIALDLSLRQAAQTKAYIDQLSKTHHRNNNSTTKNITSSSLDDCKEEYSEAVDDFKAATRAMKRCDYGSVNELVSGAMTDCQTCLDESDDEKKDDGVDYSLFVDKNKCFFKLCSNVLAIVKLVG